MSIKKKIQIPTLNFKKITKKKPCIITNYNGK